MTFRTGVILYLVGLLAVAIAAVSLIKAANKKPTTRIEREQ